MMIWIAVTLLAFFVKGLCGFANTLIFDTLLSFRVANARISPVELALGYPTNVILCWQGRRQLRVALVLPLACTVLLGSLPGALLLRYVQADRIKLFFGLLVLGMGVDMLLKERRKSVCPANSTPGISPWAPRGRLSGTILAIFAGLMCGMFGIGALLSACVGELTEDSASFKANISAVFLVESSVRLVSYTALGVLSFPVLRQAALLYPFMLLALFAGIKSSAWLPERMVRRLVIFMLLISGIMLVLANA